MKKRLAVLLSLLIIVSTLVACGAKDNDNAANDAPGTDVTEPSGGEVEEFISMGTSSSGGTFNTLGVAMSQMWSDNTKTRFSAEVTGGSSENCIRIGMGEIQMAFAASSSVYEAVNGVGSFEGKQVEGINVIGNMYPAVMQLPVLKSSGIENFGDIAGKKINIGQNGSGSESQSLAILESYGIELDSFSPSHLSHSNASDALIDEKLDGYIISGSLGQSHQMKAMSSGKARMASYEPVEKLQQLIKDYPYYYEFTIPAGAYPNQDEDVLTVATSTLLIVNEDVSEELVYQATKALFENVDVLANSQEIANEIQLENGPNVSGIKLHPGAERYYKEMGIL